LDFTALYKLVFNFKFTFSLDAFSGQLSLLLSVGREMSTSQKAVMFCGWGVKAGMAGV